MNNTIQGKVVIITGASSGIGATIAKMLATYGAVLSLAARRKDRLEQLIKEIKAAGGEATAWTTDVTKRDNVMELVKNTVDLYGKVDVMINNAGVMPLSRIDALQYDQWDQMIDTNIKGVLYGIGAVLPYMQARKSGHIINVASVAGHRVPIGSGSAVYSATKFAVRAISEGLRQEVKPYNLRTTIISPGAIRTELPDSVTDPGIRTVMQGSVFDIAISPESIARAVVYALEQPEDFDVNEILLRPTAQVS